jgi:hypothetical protein
MEHLITWLTQPAAPSLIAIMVVTWWIMAALMLAHAAFFLFTRLKKWLRERQAH